MLSRVPFNLALPLIRLHPNPISSTSTLVSRARQANSTQLRRMASTSTPGRKYEWLVVVPDKPGMLEKRMEIRPTHFANLKPNIESGAWKMGGALLDEVPADDEASSLKINGSTLVCVAESKDEVMETLRKDVYAQSGVWDLDKVQIWPFKCAFRYP